MYSRSIAILNDSDILDKVILGKIFRDMKCAEFYRVSRALLEKTLKVVFEIVISIIKILKISRDFRLSKSAGCIANQTPPALPEVVGAVLEPW